MLYWNAANLAISDHKVLTIPQLEMNKGEFWTFIGGNGSGKTALAKALCHELPLHSGIHQGQVQALRLSFEQQQQLAEKEWQMRNTDIVAEGEELGFTAEQLLFEQSQDHATGIALARQFGIEPLLCRPYRHLSSGEGRKLLLARALLQQPELLVLDEPFDGLDHTSRLELMQLLATLQQQGQSLVLIVNRFEELPEFATHLGLLSGCQLVIAGPRAQILSHPEINQLIRVEEHKQWQLPPPPLRKNWPAAGKYIMYITACKVCKAATCS